MSEFLNHMVVPGSIVALALLYMAYVLIADAYRQWRCAHANVRLVRQQRGEVIYFSRVCMACRKGSEVRP